MTAQSALTEIDDFLEMWTVDNNEMKKAFIRLKKHLENMSGVTFAFKGRAGVSYSLRAKHENQTARDLFVMVDVIDDDPEERWLSVCFYGDLITDPQEKGDLVPDGLSGEDGYCFDLDEWNEDDVLYLEARLSEACSNASR